MAALCLVVGIAGCSLFKTPVQLRDELLARYPYGSPFGSVKQHLVNKGARYSETAQKEVIACTMDTVDCEQAYTQHYFYLPKSLHFIRVGEENGKVVLLDVRVASIIP